MSTSSELRKIGARIKTRRKELKISQSHLAEQVALSAPSVSKYENGKVADASLAKLKEFARALNVSEEWLLGRPEPPPEPIPANQADVKLVPFLGETAAGAPIFAVDERGEYAVVSKAENVDFAVKIRGNSMINARIYDGDVVFARSQQSVQNGEIAIVAIDAAEGSSVTTKRFYQYGDMVVLRSENPAYKDIELHLSKGDEVRVIGKVVFLKGEIR